MNSSKLGAHTSAVEVTNISTHGVWLWVNDREYFLSYSEYPWFKDATLGNIFDVQLLHDTHLHWPKLDVDLELESLAAPEGYPLVYR